MSLKNLYENMPSEEILRRMRVEDFNTHCRLNQELNDPIMTTIFAQVFVSMGLAPLAAPLAAAASAIAMTAVTPGFRRLLK
ncbi:MAG: hypothetical protein K0M55_15845 [Rhizobium sp.]|nr:hypothetical protein [Rhizobium sp.]MBW8319270.1 hypothetical protein [Rhizobium sp.]